MSEQDAERSPMRTTASHRNVEINNSMDETAVANDSIIEKVKSRVSSIFPNSLSKWFSPSTRNSSDSLNGNTNIGRRRRHNEIEDDDDYVEEDDDEEEVDDEDDEQDEQEADEFDENVFSHQQNNSEESIHRDENSATHAVKTFPSTTATSNLKNSPRELLKSCSAMQQPPTKRSRFCMDNVLTSNISNTPLMQRPPLLTSTPDYDGGSGITQPPSSPSHRPALARSSNRYSHLNLYGNKERKEPGYDFHSSPLVATGTAKSSEAPLRFDPDIIDLVPEQDAEDNNIHSGVGALARSRRVLHIPQTASFKDVKRPSLGSGNHDFCLNTSSTFPRRTSTTIFESNADENAVATTSCTLPEVQEQFGANDGDEDDEVGEIQETANICNGREKRVKDVIANRLNMSNGSESHTTNRNNTLVTTEDADLRDSMSDSSDGACKADNFADSHMPRKTSGLFNMAATNSRNGSRSSSFGNGLNFYSHLEGRKSLFAGGSNQQRNSGNTLNNSTLSLTSLNRRQFNASIYGSTSALSDSRLLNTFSPFYKGRTTYGGAAAYNKYSMMGSGTCGNSVRITPTLIRPTSSLSTLSSSNNSIAPGSQCAENPSAISNTAKRILDLINDFATPLSEAKKMATTLKATYHQQPHLHQEMNQSASKLRRFNETDLNATRAMRLSQVSTPYTRPSVTLLPKNSSLPPVRELQVPSMSQLLKMKKMQHTTERSRKITTENSTQIGAGSTEYTLPTALEAADTSTKLKQHTNKMKNKITSARITGPKDIASVGIDNVETVPPVNLPTIAFPLMDSVPKFDIDLPRPKGITKSADVAVQPSLAKSVQIQSTGSSSIVFQGTSNTATTAALPSRTNFKFSPPLLLDDLSVTSAQNVPAVKTNYKFSPPTMVEKGSVPCIPSTVTVQQVKAQPELKSGSVLEALKCPFALPEKKSKTCTALSDTKNEKSDSLFSQFKKSSDEWECDTCMLRNKQDATKCVACETSRKVGTLTTLNSSGVKPLIATGAATNTSTTFGFGSQFRKSSDTWECEVCMICNKQDVVKCVACEAPRKNVKTNNTSSDMKPLAAIKSSFGDSFKPNPNSWECSSCLIRNKPENDACEACGSKRTQNKLINPAMATSETVEMKTISALRSKWDCRVCMTANEKSKSKCVSCEQPKPDTLIKNTPKFSFGSTAAAKYNFGFGTQNTLKDEELRKTTETSANEIKNVTVGEAARTASVFGATSISQPTTAFTNTGGLVFGVKPTSDVSGDSKDTTDNKTDTPPAVGGFKFGPIPTITPDSAITNTTKSLPTPATFRFGGNTAKEIPKSTENVASTVSSSVKFPVAATSTSTTTITSTGGGSPFDSSKSNNPFIATTCSRTVDQAPSTILGSTQKSSPSAGFTFGLPKPPDGTKATLAQDAPSSGFSFKTPSSNSTVAAAVNNSGNGKQVLFGFGTTSDNTKIADSTTTTSAAVKPLFSFGAKAFAAASSSSEPTTTTPTVTSSNQSTSFSFTSVASLPSTSTAPSQQSSVFGVMSPSTTTASATPAVFGSFVASAATPTANTFGAVQQNMKSTSITTASALISNSTFGSVATAPNASLFALGNNNNESVKPKITGPVFGALNKPHNTASGSFGSFVSSTAMATTGSDAGTSASAAAMATPSATWPKNAFSFGSPSTLATAASSTISDGANKPLAFGNNNSFGTITAPTVTSAASFTPIFGTNLNQPSSSNNLLSKVGTFRSTATSNSVFGAGSPASLSASGVAPTSNLFGSAVTANATTSSASASVFGSSNFGNNNTLSAVAPQFGSTAPAAAASNTFGCFGSAPAASNTTADGASAAKKSQPAFNFGATAAAPQSTSGGFNFSANAPKPAFNFGASTAAATSFNFTGSAAEATPNAPFQFNAGVTQPATSNIFAPSPTPAGAQNAQQARRKIRAPIRRLTPR